MPDPLDDPLSAEAAREAAATRSRQTVQHGSNPGQDQPPPRERINQAVGRVVSAFSDPWVDAPEPNLTPTGIARDLPENLARTYRGAQNAVAQTGEEIGAPQLGRDVASIPDAFVSPESAHYTPHVVPDLLSLDHGDAAAAALKLGTFTGPMRGAPRGAPPDTFRSPNLSAKEWQELDRAKSMASHMPDETKWRETGWYNDPLAGWTTEISDHEMEIDPIASIMLNQMPAGDTGLTVGHLIKHDRLFAAHPELKDIPVHVHDDLTATDISLGAFDPGPDGPFDPKNTALIIPRPIDISNTWENIKKVGNWITPGEGFRDVNDALKSIIIHELQHAVQRITGRPRGFDPSPFIPTLRKLGFSADDAEAIAMEMYERKHGEWQARQTQSAIDWRPEIRRHYLPSQRIGHGLTGKRTQIEPSPAAPPANEPIASTLNKVLGSILTSGRARPWKFSDESLEP